MFENGAQMTAIGDLQGVLPQTDNIPQDAEEKDMDSHDSDVMVSDVIPPSRFQESQLTQL